MYSAETLPPFRTNRLLHGRVARNVRHAHEHRRLRKDLLTLIQAQSHLSHIGKNWAVTQLATDLGFKLEDLVVARMRAHRAEVTVVAVPTRLWHRAASKKALLSLKREAASLGYRCVLLPENALRRRPLLDNARLLASSSGAEVSVTIRMTLIAFLIENGPSSLIDCSQLVSGKNSFEAVLHLASIGVVHMDLSAPIGPHSLVHLPA